MSGHASADHHRSPAMPLASGLLAVAMAWSLFLVVAAGMLVVERMDAHFDLVLNRNVFSLTVYRNSPSTQRGKGAVICTDLLPCRGNP